MRISKEQYYKDMAQALLRGYFGVKHSVSLTWELGELIWNRNQNIPI